MVSIIILSYNTSDLLEKCLTSLIAHTDDVTYEIIVVDNASKDDSVSMVKRLFSKVVLIENTENSGFAKGCNIGAKQAKGEFLLFLNSDTILKKSQFKKMVEVAQGDSRMGIIGGKFHNIDGSRQRSFGSFYTLPSVFFMLLFGDRGELLRNTADTLQYVDWVSGGFMLAKRSVFEKVRGFDEQFFMYIEDMELCFRIKQAGYSVCYIPEAVIEHVGHGSSNRTFAIVQIYKGLVYFYKKHRSKLSYILVRLLLKSKAGILILIGKVTRNTYLVQTYEKAFAVS